MLSLLRRLFGLSDERAVVVGPPPETRRPRQELVALAPADVVLDVACEDGLLFLVLANLGGEPALDVRVALLNHQAGALHALNGELDLAEHPLFSRLAMLRGAKELRVLLDPAVAWFQRDLDGRFTVKLTWRDRSGCEHTAQYRHDLGAFRVGVDRIGP